MPRRARIAALVVLANLGLAVLGVLAIDRWFAGRDGPKLARAVKVAWPEGLGASESAALLHDLGLTDSPRLMSLYLRLAGVGCIKPGPHMLPGGATPPQLRAMLCRDERRPVATVTIPEGYHRFAVAERLEQKGVVAAEAFLHASADAALLGELGLELGDIPAARTAEGYLFPATYRFRYDAEPHELVRVMVREAQSRYRGLATKYPEGVASLKTDRGFGLHQTFVLASMVEKEAARASERPLIASVFLNRLASRELRRLQSDPTAVYGCLALGDAIPACAGFDGRASGAVNRDPNNAYSTYLLEGLPPGPIASPGEASIEAVLAPADTSYLYFVAKGGGEHTFSSDYAAHLEAVKKLREERR